MPPSMLSLHPYSRRIINFMVNVFYPSFGSISKTKASNNVAVFQINSVTLHSPIIKSTCLVYLVVRGREHSPHLGTCNLLQVLCEPLATVPKYTMTPVSCSLFLCHVLLNVGLKSGDVIFFVSKTQIHCKHREPCQGHGSW